MLPLLFAVAPFVATSACHALSIVGLLFVDRYGGHDTRTKRGNVKATLIVFYSLVLTQIAVWSIWNHPWERRLNATQSLSSEYFGVGNRYGKELVNRYVTQTQDKCIENGVFSTTNRTLVSFAAELLQSEYRLDHVSAVSVLRVLIRREERAAGTVEQMCSYEQAVGSLFKLLRSKIPLDPGTKADIAEIVEKLACKLRLTDIPGAAHSISSLLDPHPRLISTRSPRATGNASGAEPSAPGETQTQTNSSNQGGARDKPLIVHGLEILCVLASDPGNCTEICKTTDLVPKIMAPVSHGMLKSIGNNDPKTVQIVNESLHVLAKLTRGTGESSRNLRRELSDNGKAAENILWIMRNSSDQEMRIVAVEILTRLTLDQERMPQFIAELKDLLCDPQDSSLRVSAGKALNALAIDPHNCEVIWEQVGDDFPALVRRMNADGTSMEHRAVTAEFLAQICAKCITDEARTRIHTVSNALSAVLEAIITTEITDMTERMKFLASFLGLAVQIREKLVTPEAFASAVRGLPVGRNIFAEEVFYFQRDGQVFFRFIKFAEKLKGIIFEATDDCEDKICLVITKAATKLVTWTMRIDHIYAHYFQQENIVGKLDAIMNAMGDIERCLVLSGDADEMQPTFKTLVEEVRSLLPSPPLQH